MTFTEPDPPPPRYAFLGVRSCDLRAIAVQDRVLGVSSTYARRRRETLIIAVDCTEPSATCFCVSAGGGPDARDGFDIALTELTRPGDAEPPRYLAVAGTDAGRTVPGELPQLPAEPSTVARAEAAVSAAASRMERALPEVDLRRLLAGTLEAARWDDVASRCLTCGNCTMACPTCFCTVHAFGVGEIPISVSGGQPGLIRHTVRAVGAVSRAICEAPVGSTLGLRGPFGRGWPAPPVDADVVVLAGGIGLAPLRPVVTAALARSGRVWVLIGARTPDDLIFTDEYDAWRGAGAHVLVTVDRADAGWTHHADSSDDERRAQTPCRGCGT